MGRLLKRLLIFVTVVAIVFFICWKFEGSSMGRSFAERRMGNALGMDAKITGEHKMLGFFWLRESKGVEGRVAGTDDVVFTADSISRGYVCGRTMPVVNSAKFIVKKGEAGDISPFYLAPLANGIGGSSSQLIEALSSISDKMPYPKDFTIRNGSVFLRDPEGKDTPILGGFNWQRRSVTLWDVTGRGIEAKYCSVWVQSINGKAIEPGYGISWGSEAQLSWIERVGKPVVILDGARPVETPKAIVSGAGTQKVDAPLARPEAAPEPAEPVAKTACGPKAEPESKPEEKDAKEPAEKAKAAVAEVKMADEAPGKEKVAEAIESLRDTGKASEAEKTADGNKKDDGQAASKEEK